MAPARATEEEAPLAAVDLGSNSFHLVVARLRAGVPEPLDRVRERVRLAAGLDAENRMAGEAVERALGCLRRFRQLLRGVPAERVRAVGTNTFRKAANLPEFLPLLEAALGHPIEVVGGAEEARLIHLGVCHSVDPGPGRHLVLDIGGGSTECILGEGFEARLTASFQMGCVSWSRRFFPGGRLRRRALQEAVAEARLEIEPVARRLRPQGWGRVLGASGTIKACARVLREEGWSPGGIAREGLERLAEALLEADRVEELELRGLREERRPVFAGGLALLLALFRSLGLENLEPAPGALREGLLYDLLGRLGREDVRERTLGAFEERFAVDREQGRRVAGLARELHQGLAPAASAEDRLLLEGAARLHELGLFLSASRHHEHGAYVVRHADMPGFSRGEQEALAVLLRNARRSLDPRPLETLPERERDAAWARILALRLAVRLARSRSEESLPPRLALRREDRTLRLELPATWLADHPLTRADLEHEARRLRPHRWRLIVETV